MERAPAPAAPNTGCRHRIVAGPESDDRSLAALLAHRLPRASLAEWTARIRRGEVLVEREAVRDPKRRVPRGAVVEWFRPRWVEPRAPRDFVLLHRDRHVLAVGKPRGLPTLPGGGRFHENTLLARLRAFDSSAAPVHRLGRPTSGVVLCGRSQRARSGLSKLLRDGRVRKTYLALVRGRLQGPARRVEVPIGPRPHRRLGTIAAASAHGRPSLSIVAPLAPRGDDTLVRIELVTGRTHQARIHCAALGHPLVGDLLYRPGGEPDPEVLPGEGGFFLHAWRVALPHPTTGEPLCVECPPPPALRPERTPCVR